MLSRLIYLHKKCIFHPNFPRDKVYVISYECRANILILSYKFLSVIQSFFALGIFIFVFNTKTLLCVDFLVYLLNFQTSGRSYRTALWTQCHNWITFCHCWAIHTYTITALVGEWIVDVFKDVFCFCSFFFLSTLCTRLSSEYLQDRKMYARIMAINNNKKKK